MNSREFLSEQDMAYEKISPFWENLISQYDLQRRIEVLVYNFLSDQIHQRECIDIGAGLGFFTKAIHQFKPKAIAALDIAPSLVKKIQEELPYVEVFCADLLTMKEKNFPNRSFDLVISSEVIEHTPDPRLAVKQHCAILSHGGLLSISCPNYYWKWLLHLANLLKIRQHYQGHENWLSPFELLQLLKNENMVVLKKTGIHSVPWHFLPKFMLRKIDSLLGSFNFYFAVNLAVLAKKNSP